jgi:hypothetical protein
MDPRQNDKMLIDKYASPIAPPALVLLEANKDTVVPSPFPTGDNASPNSPSFRNSLLLDANDELSLQFLVSAAAFDSAEYTVLSLEEVERLKREHMLLISRIESSTRKLALESKVRDASQNLVKLHQTRNKRLSKQAEEQLHVATRKVDDLATELWRLQRREATTRQQLMEHTAGVLSRSVRQVEQMRQMASFQEFDEAHLYVDASVSYQSAHDGSREAASKDEHAEREAVMRAEARLRETHRQLRGFLQDKASRQDEDDEEEEEDDADDTFDAQRLEVRIAKLDETLLSFQEQHLQQKQDKLVLQEQQGKLLKALWEALEGDPLVEVSQDTLVPKLKELQDGVKTLTAALSRALAERDEAAEGHAAAMKDLQALYEKELDDVHNKLDDMTEKHDMKVRETRSLTDKVRVHEQDIKRQNDDLALAHSKLDELVQRQASIQNAALTDRSLAKQHEESLTRLMQSTSSSRNADAEALQRQRQRADEYERQMNQHRLELKIHRDRLEMKDQEVLRIQAQHAEALQEHGKTVSQVTEKHQLALSQLATLTQERQALAAQIELKNNEESALKQSLQDAKARIEILEAQAKAFEEQETLLRGLETDVLELTKANAVLQADLDTLQGTRLDREAAQAQASRDALVMTLEGEKATLHEQLVELTSKHASLLDELNRTQSLVQSTREAHRADDKQKVYEARCEVLQGELDAMLMEYEAMTRSALFYESQRTKSENKSDALMEKIVELEAQVADYQVQTLGLGGTETAGQIEPPTTAQLRKEFRKLVQDLRAEHAKREQQDYLEIKRLERALADIQGHQPMGSTPAGQSSLLA